VDGPTVVDGCVDNDRLPDESFDVGNRALGAKVRPEGEGLPGKSLGEPLPDELFIVEFASGGDNRAGEEVSGTAIVVERAVESEDFVHAPLPSIDIAAESCVQGVVTVMLSEELVNLNGGKVVVTPSLDKIGQVLSANAASIETRTQRIRQPNMAKFFDSN
jgi:hypothetical protein